MKKPIYVKKILPDGFIMFNDRWVSKHDKMLYNHNNEIFHISDYKEIELTVPIMDIQPLSIFRKRIFPCVKLDKQVKENDVFYIMHIH